MTPDDVRAFRARHKLTQATLAERVGVSGVSIRHYEQGLRPVPEWFKRFLRLLGRELRLKKALRARRARRQ